MKSLLFVLLTTAIFPINDTIYIKSTITDKGCITINFDNLSSLKCQIKKDSHKRWFSLKDGYKIYLDVDHEAKLKMNLDSFLRANTLRPQLHLGEPLPIRYLVFIIDENGKITQKGLDRELPSDDYQKEFIRLMKLIKTEFEPATIGGKKVASILKMNINYYKLFDN